MADAALDHDLTAEQYAEALSAYLKAGEAKARSLGNRGPIRLDDTGKLHPDIVAEYWKQGFYVFENVVDTDELEELRADVQRLLDGAPTEPDGDTDRFGRPALAQEFRRPAYRWAKPLSDPLGGTSLNKGRHPVKMSDARPSDDAPEWTVQLLDGNLQLMPSCFHLYGHPGLLAIAEAINGADFVPYNEVTFVKEPGLGPSVAWHQDGTTHWDADDWDEGAHGFNFMTQLYPSTAANCVWTLPGSHKLGKVDIKKLVADSGSDRIDGAVPMVCEPGDVMVLNRQAVHGSFANASPDRRVTLNAGFFPRRRVLNVTTEKLDGVEHTYTEDRIRNRSRLIALAVDARQQKYPHEPRYTYQPFAGQDDECRWNEDKRESVLKDYNLQDMYI